MAAARILGFDVVGTLSDDRVVQGAVHRLRSAPTSPPKFSYLVVSDTTDNMHPADLVTISNFQSAKSALKRKIKKGLGIEFLLAEARRLSAIGVAKFFRDLRDAYAFCESSGYQFVLSSGAQSPREMISSRCFDEVLAEIGIDHRQYWKTLEVWLSETVSRKVVLQ